MVAAIGWEGLALKGLPQFVSSAVLTCICSLFYKTSPAHPTWCQHREEKPQGDLLHMFSLQILALLSVPISVEMFTILPWCWWISLWVWGHSMQKSMICSSLVERPHSTHIPCKVEQCLGLWSHCLLVGLSRKWLLRGSGPLAVQSQGGEVAALLPTLAMGQVLS